MTRNNTTSWFICLLLSSFILIIASLNGRTARAQDTQIDTQALITDTDSQPIDTNSQSEVPPTQKYNVANRTAFKEPLGMMDMNFDQLLDTPIEVWTATKTATTVYQAPAIITVITRDDIRNHGYQSVGEILNHVLGFYQIDDHILPNLGVRGIAGSFKGESGLIKVMIDGQNSSFRSNNGNWLGPELIPLSIIDRIEIIRGPASALYGADAFLGIVNVITLNGEYLSGAVVQGSRSWTSYNKQGYDIDFTVGTKKNAFELLVSAKLHHENRSGLKIPSSSPSPRIPSYNEGNASASHLISQSEVAFARLTYHFNQHHKLHLIGHFSQIDRSGEFSPLSQLNDGIDTQGRQRKTTIALQKKMAAIHFDLTPVESVSINWKAAFSQGTQKPDDRININNDFYYIQRDFGYDSIETSADLNWRVSSSLSTVLGGEFIYDKENLPSSLRVLTSTIEEQSPGDVLESSSTRQGKKSFYNIGAFIQVMWTKWQPYVNLIGGLRFDNHNLYGYQASSRAGIVATPMKSLNLKFLYGSAFMAPSPLLLYGVPHQVRDIIGNPKLKPQNNHTLEFQGTFSPKGWVKISSGVSYIMLYNKAEFVQQGINLVAANIAEVKSLSWETELNIILDQRFQANIGFEKQWSTQTFQHPESAYYSYLIGKENLIYPDYIIKSGISTLIPKVPIRLSMRAMLVGSRPASAMNALENLSMYSLPTYFILSGAISTVGVKLISNRETTISLIGRNLTSSKVANPGFAGIDYPLAPLTILLQLRQEL